MRSTQLMRLAAGVALLSALALTGARQPDSPATAGAVAGADEASFRGRVTGWWVNDLGHVSFRIAVERNDQSMNLWFRTPADRASATRLEDLTLEAVLQLCDTDTRLTVIADRSEGDHGRTRDDALEILGFGRI